eukprot:6199714-Pleurochrysis_carterae.AAC.2
MCIACAQDGAPRSESLVCTPCCALFPQCSDGVTRMARNENGVRHASPLHNQRRMHALVDP